MEDWLYSGSDAVGKWGQFYDGLSFIFFFELILVALGLGCCNWAPSTCRELELPFLAQASHRSGFSWRAQALGARASAVAACGLSRCGLGAPELRLSGRGARA